MANTVNAALKPLETLSRIVNQPSSLFGGKGGSSKNKTEHDTVGTARDSNSNTQDQGSRISPRRQSNTRSIDSRSARCSWFNFSQASPVRQSRWRAVTECREQTATSWMERQRATRWSLLVSQRFLAHKLCRWLTVCYTQNFNAVSTLHISSILSACNRECSGSKRWRSEGIIFAPNIWHSICVVFPVFLGREWVGGSDWWAAGERCWHREQHNHR